MTSYYKIYKAIMQWSTVNSTIKIPGRFIGIVPYHFILRDIHPSQEFLQPLAAELIFPINGKNMSIVIN